MHTLAIDFITEDHANDEFFLYLVENGPWVGPLESRLREIQNRLYDSFDAIVDGHLAAKYPKSKGRKIRVQVDAHGSPPEHVLEFVRKFAMHLENDAESDKAITNSPFVQTVRVVNGADMERQLE